MRRWRSIRSREIPIEEGVRETVEEPNWTRWVDTHKGDDGHPDYRSGRVAQELRHDEREREDSFAAAPPPEYRRHL